MSLEAAITERAKTHAGLNALIAARVYADVAEQESATPFLVYQIIDTVPSHAMGLGIVNSAVRVQLDYYAATKTAAITGRVQVLAAFNAWAGSFGGETIKASMLEDHRSFIELPDTAGELKRESLDFMVQL